ncbi:hypothetical protein P175DRAFT_0505308 [Aspergillus ochraceoroseus IBT 24754]|uniref:Galactose oxidase-like Early set domain-containing protein n=2 Tax=Aspergillus ochraceoroseus TaxID=138278 RepID=A0A2T5LLI9_9EURO|nr:uncharacterized protein P175DRAFT_0505308 [Aspergillus ochraceoroseus IBT 24754]KKK15083.1 hypothetical protein AOCH_007491 [Aspergillus ochraceoroseus]PTU17151.1 hypothetical protein P175DRAFT_0505308 [Aspergillus ochraceoroseus IBT 24754]
MHRAVGSRLLPTILCALPWVGRVHAGVPYTPSSLIYSPHQNGSFAYLLRPGDPDQNRTEFLSLNVSGDIDPDNPVYTVLLDEAPFRNHSGTSASAYVSVVDQYGVVKVYTGDCQNPDDQGMLWQFQPDSSSSTGNGTWAKFSVDGTEGQTSGPNYLSAGFAFASSNTTQTSLFAFAGMCPYQDDPGTSWIAAANYSQMMMMLDPVTSDDGGFYQASTTSDRAPPIPEAGFTITPLQATYAYLDGERRQQQDFLLIGGHTQQAFINMSELAIFSAPQNSWSFATVDSVIETQKTERAIRDTSVEPRSGHTAVLSPDGSQVVVFGGWVGNTSVPATPQLAVLEIGGGFAGSGDWVWKIPSMTDAGIADGTGIYGHGATMLPGGVMMIAGGYQISQSSKRSVMESQLNPEVYLYNVTAGSWAPSYQNPNAVALQQSVGVSSAESGSSSSKKAGLGVGLGLGIPALAGLAIFVFFFRRRHMARRTRSRELRKLALGAQRAHFWGRDEPNMASSIRDPSMSEAGVNSDYPWNMNNNNRSFGRNRNWRANGEAAAERTGLLGDVPSPAKHHRPASNARMHRPPTQYNDYRRGEATSDIHPIDEREEDEERSAGRSGARDPSDPSTGPEFPIPQEPCLKGKPPGPFSGSESVALGSPTADGRISPDKSERTSSTLSDSSTSSAKSTKSACTSGPSGEKSRNRDSVATTLSYEKRYSSDSYSTAHTSFSQRQIEGEHLLQDAPEPSAVLVLSRPRASEWIGNVRRVLSVTRKRPSINKDPNPASLASGIDGRHTVLGISAAEARIPQRSVSASAELFRRKQGAKDWGAGTRASRESMGGMAFHTARSTRADLGLERRLDPESDEDWDVERAAEGRRVQVTFTVPKEKLRVVNATARDLDDLSEKSVSRRNSSSYS